MTYLQKGLFPLGVQGTVMEPTMNLRYVTTEHTTTDMPVLQQQWVDINTGLIEWRPIRIEVIK